MDFGISYKKNMFKLFVSTTVFYLFALKSQEYLDTINTISQSGKRFGDQSRRRNRKIVVENAGWVHDDEYMST